MTKPTDTRSPQERQNQKASAFAKYAAHSSRSTMRKRRYLANPQQLDLFPDLPRNAASRSGASGGTSN